MHQSEKYLLGYYIVLSGIKTERERKRERERERKKICVKERENIIWHKKKDNVIRSTKEEQVERRE